MVCNTEGSDPPPPNLTLIRLYILTKGTGMGAFPLRWYQKESGGRKLAARPQINDVATKRAEDRRRWVQ